MSSLQGNHQRNFAYLINPYGKPISRLARTKNNHQDSTIQSKPSEQVISKQSLLVRKGRNENTPSKVNNIIPVKLSQLSSSVVFQDIDSPHKSISKKSIQQSPKQILSVKQKEISQEITSLTDSNQMVTKTHHKKITIEISQSPIQNAQAEQMVTPKKSSVGSSTPKNRFSRKRQSQLLKVDQKNELSLNINSEKSFGKDTEEITDRTVEENSRKIERKLDGKRREIKFVKETKSQIIIQQPEKLNKLENQQLNSKTQASQLKYTKKQPSQTVQQENLEQNLVSLKQLSSKENLSVISKTVLKRSTLIAFVIKKLLYMLLTSTLNRLKLVNYRQKIKFSNEIPLLSKSVLSISKNKNRGLIKWSFESLKASFSLSYISELKNALLYKPVNRTHISLNILQKIYQSKLRKTWVKIIMKHLWSKNQIKALNFLDKFLKKNESKLSCQSFQLIKRKTSTKLNLLHSLTSIFNNFHKNKVRIAFLKISFFCKSELIISSLQKQTSKIVVRQSLTTKEQQNPNISNKTNAILQAKSLKLKSTISQSKDSLALLTKKLKQSQSRALEQKNQLEQKINDLKQSNKQIQVQLNTKKTNIQTIRRQMNNIPSKIQTKITKNQISIQDEKLTKLAKVYMDNSVNVDTLLSPAQILYEYQLNVNYCTKSYEQWQLLAQNIDLNRHIAVFQNRAQFQFTARKVGVCEQQVVAKLLRNYIRQQYFRQWLHVTSQSFN